MYKKLYVISLAGVIGMLCSTVISAEYNSRKLGEAIGGYLIANDMFEKLSESECGYIVNRTYSFDAALKETMPYLSEPDKRELRSFLASKKFKKDLEENNEFIRGFMRAGKKDGLDERTICGMIASNIAVIYQKAKQKWEYAKQRYSK